MSATKITISPVENMYIKLVLSIQDMDKDKLEDLGDSFLLKMNKKSKSGNELNFSIFFNKKLINKPVRTSNPTISITKNKHLVSLEVTIMLELNEVSKEESFYWIKKEYATTPPFEISYKMNPSYYDKKIGQHLVEVSTDKTN
ncbi:hypothetical protein [Niallia sp. 03190]|uniref:hypothetical protein n=1 Tax=Niallia sp. 03190 TaxID=3458061 RepID=UPI00404511F8